MPLNIIIINSFNSSTNFTTNFIDSEKNLFKYQLKAGIDLFSDRSKGISPLETIINHSISVRKGIRRIITQFIDLAELLF